MSETDSLWHLALIVLPSQNLLAVVGQWSLEDLYRAVEMESVGHLGTALAGIAAIVGLPAQFLINRHRMAMARREHDAQLKAARDELDELRRASEDDAYRELERLLSDLLKLRISYPDVITAPYVNTAEDPRSGQADVMARKSAHANLIYNFVEAIYDHSRDRPKLEKTWRSVGMHEAERELGWLAVPRHQNQFKSGFRRWLCSHAPTLRKASTEERAKLFMDIAKPLPPDDFSREAVWQIYTNAIEASEQKPKEAFLAMLADQRYLCAVAYDCDDDEPDGEMRRSKQPKRIIGFALVFVPSAGGSLASGSLDFTVLEYMATDSLYRRQGIGAALFHAAKALFSHDRPMLLEVDSVRQSRAEFNGPGKQSEREARMRFYKNEGCKQIAGLRYDLPLPGQQPEMVILCSDDAGRASLSRDEVECCLRTLYVDVYGQAANDRRIGHMLQPLPPDVELVDIEIEDGGS